MPKTITSLKTYYLSLPPAAAEALAAYEAVHRPFVAGVTLNDECLASFLADCDRSLLEDRLIYFPQPRAGHMTLYLNQLVELCQPLTGGTYDFAPVIDELSVWKERLTIATHDDRYLGEIIGGQRYDCYLRIEIYELEDRLLPLRLTPEPELSAPEFDALSPELDRIQREIAAAVDTFQATISHISVNASLAASDFLKPIIKINADCELLARNFARSLGDVVPPMLELLADVRASLGFSLEELAYLGEGMMAYDQRDPDTTPLSRFHLIGIFDILDWDAWNQINGPKLQQAIHLLLLCQDRSTDLKVLALLDGLRQAIRLTEVELAEHINHLDLEQALAEVFDLEV